MSLALSAPPDINMEEAEEGAVMGACPMWNLPDEILLSMLAFLPIEDLCNVIQTCRRFHALGTTKVIQSTAKFPAECWPFLSKPEKEEPAVEEGAVAPTETASITNLNIFERAARAGNFEANIKLGVACLYGEGLDSMAETAYEMLNRAEEMVGSAFPFAWLLFRPPWSSNVCSKALIFRKMKAQAEENAHVWTKKFCGIMFCVAKTLSLQQTAEEKAEAEKWFGMAASKGCGDAAYELYQLRRANAISFDVGARTENIRYLRGFEGSQSWNVEVSLCTEYARGNFAGKGAKAAQHYFLQKVQQNSQLTSAHQLYATDSSDLDKDGKMRYILVDWLVEVADLKTFSRETLYMTVGLVDRYLQRYDVTRKTLQLLGISCMVIAARFTESEVITIREAAWLTDNTYKYEQVVRTMGSALCAAGGKLRVPTTLDFLQLYVALESIPQQREEVLHYLSELALLNIPVGQIPPGLMAAAMVFLAGAGMKLSDADCWPAKLALWSGLQLADVATVIRRVTAECFRSDEVKDHRDEKLKAVADRYQRHTGHTLEESGFAPPSHEQLDGILRRLGVDDEVMDVAESIQFGAGASDGGGSAAVKQQTMEFDVGGAPAGMDVEATHYGRLKSIGNTLPNGAAPVAGAKRAADPARQQVTPTDSVDFTTFG